MESSAKRKILNLLLVLSFQVGYLEWGGSNSSFIFRAEWDIIRKAASAPEAFLHPFILIPLCGLLLLLVTLFQKDPSRKLTLAGLACLSVLMLFLFFIGVIALNAKIVCAAIPFLIAGFFVWRSNRKGKL